MSEEKVPEKEKKGIVKHVGGFKDDEAKKKKSFIYKYLNRFFNKQALDPVIRGFLSDILIGGIQRMINGNNATITPTAFQNLGNNLQAYNRMFQNNLMQQQQQQQQAISAMQMTDYSSNVYLVESRVQGIELINAITAAIKTHGFVRVSDVNEANDKPDKDWTDNDYGWVDISGYQIQPQVFGGKYLVILPPPINIKGMERRF